ncbi:cytochrome c550 [Bacillus taeanensis]|uniref:Cytochrome c n=1 Tax=Bacillus taeanensis TaxID=273032 RepID=A0A366XVU6_9BACI|nr:cytochrome c [Bacillus taeanensis]RBW70520.1 cytochrome c [Bacillus taeanensis]
MKGNPLIPFLVTAVAGFILILTLSFVGLNNLNEEAHGGEETAELAPEEIYTQTCSGCHGGELEGGMGPNLQQVGSKYSAEEIATILEEGLPGGMPSGLVSGADKDKLAEWLAEKK